MALGPWSLNFTPEFRQQQGRLEPITTSFVRRFNGISMSLMANPRESSHLIAPPPPERRVIYDRAFTPGFEVVYLFEVDEEAHTVTLHWLDRVFVEEPDYLGDCDA